jgi:hypothetical protein
MKNAVPLGAGAECSRLRQAGVELKLFVHLLVLAGLLALQMAFQNLRAKERNSPEELVLIEPEVALAIRRLPLELMEFAVETFENDPAEAAGGLRAAAKAFRVQVYKAMGDERTRIVSAADSLNKMADGIREGLVGGKGLWKGVAEVSLLAAEHHSRRARRLWNEKDFRRAGGELQVAAEAAALSAEWSGTKLGQERTGFLVAAERMGDRLSRGRGWTSDRVEASLSRLEQAVETLGRPQAAGASRER